MWKFNTKKASTVLRCPLMTQLESLARGWSISGASSNPEVQVLFSLLLPFCPPLPTPSSTPPLPHPQVTGKSSIASYAEWLWKVSSLELGSWQLHPWSATFQWSITQDHLVTQIFPLRSFSIHTKYYFPVHMIPKVEIPFCHSYFCFIYLFKFSVLIASMAPHFPQNNVCTHPQPYIAQDSSQQ